MKKMTVAAIAAVIWSGHAGATPIVGGFNSSVLQKCDDCSLYANLGFSIDFNGQAFSGLFINNNGNVTFGRSNANYTIEYMAGYQGVPIIAPYYADVDTSFAVKVGQKDVQGSVSFGQGHYTGASGIQNVAAYHNANAFGVTWRDVTFYGGMQDSSGPKLNTFQLLLIENDLAPGAFEIMFNVESIQWTMGPVSRIPGVSGFSDGTGTGLYYDIPGSGTQALTDGGSSPLKAGSQTNPSVPGQYAFLIATGERNAAAVPEPGTLALLSLGSLALILNRRRRARP